MRSCLLTKLIKAQTESSTPMVIKRLSSSTSPNGSYSSKLRKFRFSKVPQNLVWKLISENYRDRLNLLIHGFRDSQLYLIAADIPTVTFKVLSYLLTLNLTWCGWE